MKMIYDEAVRHLLLVIFAVQRNGSRRRGPNQALASNDFEKQETQPRNVGAAVIPLITVSEASCFLPPTRLNTIAVLHHSLLRPGLSRIPTVSR